MKILDFFILFLKKKTYFEVSSYKLLGYGVLFFLIAHNGVFWQQTLHVYSLSAVNSLYLASLFFLIYNLTFVLLIFFNFKYVIKPLLMTLVIVSSVVTYYMATYHVMVDEIMIQNAVETSTQEVFDLLSVKLFVYLFLLGILPAIVIYKTKIIYHSFKREIYLRLKLVIVMVLFVVGMLVAFSSFYSSFFRENPSLRGYINPLGYIYGMGYYLNDTLNEEDKTLKPLGRDAVLKKSQKPKLIILVVGETARADRFSLNGYSRETNPLLKKEGVVSFTNFYSCGTSTAVSVPCMFSIYGRNDYNDVKGRYTESLLDVLNHAGIDVLWRDNNSNSKGVAVRLKYEDFKDMTTKPYCKDGECRDEVMIADLQSYFDKETKDRIVVLHQMGSHGPAYYKRYPKAFEKFTPVCTTNQLEDCEDQALSNAYDNTILYTDYFLTKTIELLKKNEKHYDVAMLYISDHGESLGEKGLYLHGYPYFLAPKVQKHVGVVFWMGEGFKALQQGLESVKNEKFSHDNLFHSVLGLMGVQTSVYEADLDIFNIATHK